MISALKLAVLPAFAMVFLFASGAGAQTAGPGDEQQPAAASTPPGPQPDSVSREPAEPPQQAGGQAAPASGADEAQASPDAARASSAPPPRDADPASEPSPGAAEAEPDKDAILVVASWGGAYSQSQDYAYFTPFSKQTGHKVQLARHDGGLDPLKAQAAAGNVKWDVIDLSAEGADRACEAGLIERLDAAALLSPAGSPALQDFLPGSVRPCAIGSMAWSTVILYNKTTFAKRLPASPRDFFDVAQFPGKRALPKEPKYTLELALLADGVAVNDVYAVLSTPEGTARAFAKLSSIKDHIIWWQKGHEPLRQLAAQEAAMTLAFSGRAFSAIVGERRPFGIIWDGQIYDFNLWAIPKGAAQPALARQFIRFATEPERLAAQTRWFPYGPVRVSSLGHVGKHAELDLEMKPFLPTYAQNFKNALAFDGKWWTVHEAALKTQFEAWLAGRGADAAAGNRSASSSPTGDQAAPAAPEGQSSPAR